MNQLINVTSSSLSLPSGTYIYSIVPVSTRLAALSSDDSIRVFDKSTLTLLPGGCLSSVHDGVTCISVYDETTGELATAGKDGRLRCWDVRSGKKVVEFGEVTVASTSPVETDPSRQTVKSRCQRSVATIAPTSSSPAPNSAMVKRR